MDPQQLHIETRPSQTEIEKGPDRNINWCDGGWRVPFILQLTPTAADFSSFWPGYFDSLNILVLYFFYFSSF
jgi:hypothetical protein